MLASDRRSFGFRLVLLRYLSLGLDARRLGLQGYAWLGRAHARDLGTRLPAIYASLNKSCSLSMLAPWFGRAQASLGRAQAKELGIRFPCIYASSDLELYSFYSAQARHLGIRLVGSRACLGFMDMLASDIRSYGFRVKLFSILT